MFLPVHFRRKSWLARSCGFHVILRASSSARNPINHLHALSQLHTIHFVNATKKTENHMSVKMTSFFSDLTSPLSRISEGQLSIFATPIACPRLRGRREQACGFGWADRTRRRLVA
jgi:hypothetical protein